tara:strand:- start:38 stop:373 length:336 start_codon:yes stop_codon:yes gene_type:complete
MPTIHLNDARDEVFTVYKTIEELQTNDLLIETDTYKKWFKQQQDYRDDYDSSLTMEEWWDDMGMCKSWEEEVNHNKQVGLCEEKLIHFMPQYGGWISSPEEREKIYNYPQQ